MTTPEDAGLSRNLDLVRHLARLEGLYSAFDEAETDLSGALGVPLCVEGCGRCCDAIPVALGLEAESVASFLLGRPDLLAATLDACREWLLRPGQWAYGRSLSGGRWRRLRPELERATTGPCPWLSPELRCRIYPVRPLVCRGYGVSRAPMPDCRRPLGAGESLGRRAVWESSGANSPALLYQWLVSTLRDTAYDQQGFLPTLLLGRFRAAEVAGLVDSGRVPLVKSLVTRGGTALLLWQSQADRRWHEMADQAIADEIPLVEVDGMPRLLGRPRAAGGKA